MRATPSVSGTAPIVAVRDVSASLAFYTERLGFEQELSNPDYGYALVRRDQLMIALTQVDSEEALKATANNVCAQLWMQDVAGYWDEIRDRFSDYPPSKINGPMDRDYGVRELHIKDPDGFLMFFTDLNDLTQGT